MDIMCLYIIIDIVTLDLESSLFLSERSKGTWKTIHRDMEQAGNENKINYGCVQLLYNTARGGVLN